MPDGGSPLTSSIVRVCPRLSRPGRPFHLGDIYAWLDEVAEGLDPSRKLSDWFQTEALPSEPPAVRLESSRGVRQDNGVSKARDRWLTV